MKNNKAQNEMVGFAIILVIVSVALLIFFAISVKPKSDDLVKSYEVEAFMQVFLEYTTNCMDDYGRKFLPVKKVIKRCVEQKPCNTIQDGEIDSCFILEKELGLMFNESLNPGEDSLIKGFLLNITYRGEEKLSIQEGNATVSSKGASQAFEDGLDILIITYS